MTLRIFTITERIIKLRKITGSKNICKICNGIIKVGDAVATKYGVAKYRKPIRHESCARRVGLIE